MTKDTREEVAKALANLSLEARHYLNTGIGRQFLAESIDRAERLLAHLSSAEEASRA